MSQNPPKAVTKRFEIPLDFAVVKKTTSDTEQRIAFGWATICTKNGVDYYDVQGDCIPTTAMFEAVATFMKSTRTAKVMHSGAEHGTVLYSLPVDNEVKKALGITCDYEGWIIGVQFDEWAWDLVQKGFLKGFSIGGARIEDTVTEEDEVAA